MREKPWWRDLMPSLRPWQYGRPTHGLSDRPEYKAWSSMRQRCQNPNNPGYKDYGGRGIKVCERWQKFENFYADMGPRPDNHSLERINNDGDYEPSNCRWASNLEQQKNKRGKWKIGAWRER